MEERLFFSKLVTKDLTAIDSNRRLFEGVLTVEMKDRQGEITIRDELMKVLPIWIARGGPITDTHSNRVVGQGINYAATTVTDSDGRSYPAITIQGEIFKDYELDNEIWEAIKSGKYKGLSFGGATKSNRTPVLEKDGSVAYSLKDLEQYEVAVCEEPAVPLALITQHNAIAKAMAGKTVDRGNGQMCIRCDKFKCYVDKGKSYDSKSGDEFSDTSDKNTPYNDENAEALENNRGEPQENGSTYHGTDKARHSLDDGVYARKEEIGVDEPPATDKVKGEKAIDEDNKDLLEEAGLEEEKKLEYANDESEGPVRKGDIDNPGGAKYNQTNAQGEKVDNYGKKIPGVMSKKPKQEESNESGSRFGTKTPGIHESLSEFRDREGKPQSKPMDSSQLAARATRVLGKPKPTHNAPYGKPTIVHAKKTLDILNATFAVKAGVDMKLGVPKPKIGLRTEGVEESLSPGKVNPKKEHMEHGSVTDAAHTNHQATSYDPDMAEKWKGDYNTDEVVREYDDEDKKKAESINTYTGEPSGGNWGREPGKFKEEETRSIYDVNQPKHVNEPTDEEGAEGVKKRLNDPGRVVGAHLDEAIGTYERHGEKHIPTSRVAPKNPSKEQRDESRAFNKNPKTSDYGLSSDSGMMGTISRDTARSLKAAGDPQLQANNSEDGVNNKIRLDSDKEAEAFTKASTPVDGSNGGSGGVRSGAAYDNAQQDTGQKDNPREVKDEKYTGEEDSTTGADTPSKFNKATIILNSLNFDLKKAFI